MQTVRTRIYDVDARGRRFLAYRPGDVVSDAEAERLARLTEPEPDKPGWMRILARQHEPAAQPPAKPLARMTVAELRAVCEAEGIDPAGANLRADYIEAIEAGRAAAGVHEKGE